MNNYHKGFTTMTVVWAVIGVLILGGIAYMATRPSVQSTEDAGRIMKPAITWQFKDAGARDNIPFTEVAVTVNGVEHEVGSYQGSCSEITETGGVDGKGLVAGELSAVQCWFAGGGDEIGVFAVEDGTMEVMVGSLGEPIEGSEGFRGDFKIRDDIKL